jgi:hypothetical protein
MMLSKGNIPTLTYFMLFQLGELLRFIQWWLIGYDILDNEATIGMHTRPHYFDGTGILFKAPGMIKKWLMIHGCFTHIDG